MILQEVTAKLVDHSLATKRRATSRCVMQTCVDVIRPYLIGFCVQQRMLATDKLGYISQRYVGQSCLFFASLS